MKDQYNNEIPEDLVLLETNDVTIHFAKKIENLDWYCVRNKSGIFVSDKELTKIIGEHDFASIWDIHVNLFNRAKLENGDVSLVGNVLKRWNDKDGFYHA